MNTQFKKGVLELLVLSILSKQDRYGYELVEMISEHIQITEGTIYPLLRRMSNDKYVSTYLKESTSGPPRKYYSLTYNGKENFLNLKKKWENFQDAVNKIINEE